MLLSNKITYLLILLIFTLSNNSLLSQKLDATKVNSNSGSNFISKKGGICFRTDDNTKSDDLFTLANIFNNYNDNYGRDYHFSLGLNFAANDFNSTGYVDSIRTLQSMGHEIMDHTPNHRTNFFITIFDTTDYLESGSNPIPGVDHLVGNKVCLKYEPVDTTKAIRSGVCDINGDTLTGSFGDFDFFDEIYLFFPALDTLVFIADTNANNSQIIIKDKWEDPINLGIHTNVKYFHLNRADINLTVDGIKVLANETQKLAAYHNLQPPVTWIQPGGRHPIFNKEELKAALGGDLNYVCGASTDGEALKVYNEYDPSDDMRFGMQWGDFFEDHADQTLDILKTKISNNIAKHKMQVGHNHFYTLTGDSPYVTKSEYFDKVDGLLAWSDSNNIEVNTYSQWADSLYNRTPDPYENVFPPLNVNLDHFKDALNPNGVPDGYYQRTHSSHGIWETDPGAPSPGEYCYSGNSWYSRIFLVQELGGIEKGENEFEIWIKGGTNDEIQVIFSFPNTTIANKEFRFPANSPNWTKFDLTQSTNSNKTLIIPDSVSVITIEVKTRSNYAGSIKVSGMYLAKKKPTISLDLKMYLEGAYDSNGIMSTEAPFQNAIPKTQPYNTSPWNYNGEESVQNIPQNVIDWVLVELRSDTDSNSAVARKAGFVKNDGTVINTDGTNISFKVAEGSYYIVIYHRNHISIMSANPVVFSAD